MRNAATSAAAPMAIETAASVVCLDLVRRDVFSSEKTIAQPSILLPGVDEHVRSVLVLEAV
jgi:hypothetical protein